MICLFADSAGLAVICGAATSIVLGEIQGSINAMPDGRCLEVGLNYFVIPYAKNISCSVE